jgi:hypothetical protein
MTRMTPLAASLVAIYGPTYGRALFHSIPARYGAPGEPQLQAMAKIIAVKVSPKKK